MTYNTRSPAVKRLMKEAQELSMPTELFYAKPLEDNLFEWHFTIRGPSETDYDGGIYHGRILLPAEYPMKPPNILLMTPSGRFEVNRKICLSISGYHPETWRPSWSIRTALLAIIGFMPTHGVGAIGSLEYPPEERRKLAKSSVEFVCPQCGGVKDMLKSLTEASVEIVEEAKSLASQITFTGDKDGEDKNLKKDKDVVIENVIKRVNSENDASVLERVPLPSTVPQAPFYPQWPMSPSMMSPMQPMSFEEWCRQMRPESSIEPVKGCEDRSSLQCSVPATADLLMAEPSLTAGDSSNIADTTMPPVVTPRIAMDNSDQSETRNRVTNQTTPIIASVSQSRDTTILMLEKRQTMLLQLMAIVASLLGLFLAVRLGSLGAGTKN